MFNNTELFYLNTLKALADRKTVLQRELDKFPEGAVLCFNRNDRRKEYYYQTYEKGKKIRKYLSPTRDKDLLDALLKKLKYAGELKKEIDLIDEILGREKNCVLGILQSFKMPPISREPHCSHKQEHREQLRYKTKQGEFVRSKTERLIADALYDLGIEYYYERPVKLGMYTICADFTILSPLDGSEKYLEHLGLEDEEYQLQ